MGIPLSIWEQFIGSFLALIAGFFLILIERKIDTEKRRKAMFEALKYELLKHQNILREFRKIFDRDGRDFTDSYRFPTASFDILINTGFLLDFSPELRNHLVTYYGLTKDTNDLQFLVRYPNTDRQFGASRRNVWFKGDYKKNVEKMFVSFPPMINLFVIEYDKHDKTPIKISIPFIVTVFLSSITIYFVTSNILATLIIVFLMFVSLWID
jgi:hypothetical protein